MGEVYMFPSATLVPSQLTCSECGSTDWSIYEDGVVLCGQCQDEPAMFVMWDL